MFIKISVSHQIMQWSHLTLSFVRFSCVFWMIIFISVHLVLFTCVVLYHYCMSLSHDLMHCLKSIWYWNWWSAENLNNESIIHINIHVGGLLSLYPLLMRSVHVQSESWGLMMLSSWLHCGYWTEKTVSVNIQCVSAQMCAGIFSLHVVVLLNVCSMTSCFSLANKEKFISIVHLT